jgi:hypothetical protein
MRNIDGYDRCAWIDNCHLQMHTNEVIRNNLGSQLLLKLEEKSCYRRCTHVMDNLAWTHDWMPGIYLS